ncbi:PP2C-like domain-containing protein CG9801 [Eumeta japonica]|uniref:PP2C-like domain-containing protein CG9801 n=1 Tax=Eumeta variegata TaxID=151549 RepID=A0A4C1SGK1_EUMVA|nr:PP2C-like domain-containing protein CG9801 [Eumeta japonica]
MITSARRKTLEQRELFYKLSTGPDGVKREVELNRMQHRSARKRVIDSAAFIALPGKLDHATVVAYTVGSGVASKQSRSTQHTPQISLTTERQLSNDDATLKSKEFQETNFELESRILKENM